MASGGQYYNFYYGSNKNACSSSTGSSSSTYSGDGNGTVKGETGRYNSRVPVTGLSSPRARLTGGGAGHYRLSAGSAGTTSWSGSGSNYSGYRNTTTAGSRVETADAYCSSPASVTSPELGSKPGSANSSLFLTRSDSVSSSGSARSTGTVCDETAASSSPRERQLRSTEPPSRAVTPPDQAAAAAASPPPSHWLDGRGAAATTSPPNRGEVVVSSRSWIHRTETTVVVHQDNNNAEASPPLQRKNSEKYDVTDESHEPSRGVMLRRGPTSPRRGRPASGTPAAGGAEAEEDTQSVSTVSGSGIDFFRKFVQRKGGGSGGGGCKECEDQFRREVLIDRLVADSKAVLAAVGSSSSSTRSSCAAPSSGL
jgi:hypothetical protein